MYVWMYCEGCKFEGYVFMLVVIYVDLWNIVEGISYILVGMLLGNIYVLVIIFVVLLVLID